MFPNFWNSLSGFNILWGQLLSITTFTLTFFVNQSYALWRKCYELSRRLQGRLNDLGMAMAAYAQRTIPDDPSEPSTYTAGSRQILELTGRYIRVFNILTYASFTSSHRPVLTPRGMRRLVDRGIITSKERQILSDAQLPVTQRHNAILLWIMRVFLEGRQAGYIEGGDGFEQQFLEKCHVIRAQYGAIGDELQGRKARAGGGPGPLFEGGQTPFYKRIPKRGFTNVHKQEMLPLNVGTLQDYIDMGRLRVPGPDDPPLTMKDFVDAGIAKNNSIKHGMKLLSKGKERLITPLRIEISRASSAAIQAIETIGGEITTVHYNRLALRALLKPHKFDIIPKRARPPPKLMTYYTNYEKRGYLSPQIQLRDLKKKLKISSTTTKQQTNDTTDEPNHDK